MKEIKLTQGKVALVDDEDFEWLNQWKWSASKSKNGYYAIRGVRIDGKNTTIAMHQMIAEKMGFKYQADHFDRNRLNNQRSNLRDATPKQNMENRGLQRNNTSGYAGVSFLRHRNKWQARIKHNWKTIHLGCFETSKEAVSARLAGEKKYWTHGENCE